MPLLPAFHQHISRLTETVDKRKVAPYVVLTSYILVGGLVIYGVEMAMQQFEDHRAYSPDKCISSLTSAWFFAIASCTTIGFGVIYPCTSIGRVLSIPYIALGVPQLFVVLADLGARLCDAMRFVVRRIRRRRYRKASVVMNGALPTEEPEVISEKEPSDDHDAPWKIFVMYQWEEDEESEVSRKSTNASQKIAKPVKASSILDLLDDDEAEEAVDIPIWIGVLLTLQCFVSMTVFYLLAESQPLWESVYGAFLTYLAGDYNVSNFNAATPAFVLVIVGFTMLSTTINIIQNNIANYVARVKRRIAEQIAAAQAEGDCDPAKAEQMMQEIMSKVKAEGGMAAKMMDGMVSKREMKSVTQFAKTVVRQANLETQVACLSGAVTKVDFECQMSDDCDTQSMATDALTSDERGLVEQGTSATVSTNEIALETVTMTERGCPTYATQVDRNDWLHQFCEQETDTDNLIETQDFCIQTANPAEFAAEKFISFLGKDKHSQDFRRASSSVALQFPKAKTYFQTIDKQRRDSEKEKEKEKSVPKTTTSQGSKLSVAGKLFSRKISRSLQSMHSTIKQASFDRSSDTDRSIDESLGIIAESRDSLTSIDRPDLPRFVIESDSGSNSDT